MQRILTVIIMGSWLASTGWLIAHDVVPQWRAESQPLRVNRARVADEAARRIQMAIYDTDRRRVGTLWTVYVVGPDSISRFDRVLLDDVAGALPGLRVDGTSQFDATGRLDEFTVRLAAVGSEREMRLHGERFPGHFAFEFDRGIGRVPTFKLDAADANMLADAFNPLAETPELHVGRSWIVQVFNPASALMGMGERFTPMLVQVTGKEQIATADGVVECFRVEAGKAIAWVDASGAVQRQELSMPLLPRLTIEREPFNESLYLSMRMSPQD